MAKHTPLNPEQVKNIQDSLKQSCESAIRTVRQVPIVGPNEMWEKLMTDSNDPVCLSFQQSVWKLAESCFASLYFAYDDFFLKCYRISADDPEYENLYAQKYHKDFGQEFGPEACRENLTEKRVEYVRLIRNSIVHNGGFPTSLLKSKLKGDLQEFEEGMKTNEDGSIVISALEFRNTYKFLYGKVVNFSEKIRFDEHLAKLKL